MTDKLNVHANLPLCDVTFVLRSFFHPFYCGLLILCFIFMQAVFPGECLPMLGMTEAYMNVLNISGFIMF